MNNNKQDAYMNNAIMTASKEELTLMLYNGAIKFCNKSIAAIQSKNVSDAHYYNMRVQAIIHEFQITLRPEYEVSKNFSVMYEYILRRLVEGNMKKDVEILEEVNELLRELRDTWKEAMKIAKTQRVVSGQLA